MGVHILNTLVDGAAFAGGGMASIGDKVVAIGINDESSGK